MDLNHKLEYWEFECQTNALRVYYDIRQFSSISGLSWHFDFLFIIMTSVVSLMQPFVTETLLNCFLVRPEFFTASLTKRTSMLCSYFPDPTINSVYSIRAFIV